MDSRKLEEFQVKGKGSWKLLVVMPGSTSSVVSLLLVAMPFVTSSFLLLVAPVLQQDLIDDLPYLSQTPGSCGNRPR